MLENNKSNRHDDTLVVLIDLIPDPVVVVDSSRRIVAANRMIRKVTGHKKEAQDIGFGLAICKRIVEAHRGAITVRTVKGKGATFTLTLPIETQFEVGGENTWINIPESSS